MKFIKDQDNTLGGFIVEEDFSTNVKKNCENKNGNYVCKIQAIEGK